MSGRGKKDCPNCHTELGARSSLCSCGYHFPTKQIREDLLKEKNKVVAPKIYTSLGQGRKKCPECNIIIGGVTKKCPGCGFDFVSAKKEKDEKEEKEKILKKARAPLKKEPEINRALGLPPYKAPKKITPEEHAERILSYGNKRAESLLEQSKDQKWSHIDWDVVKKGLE